MFGGDSLTESPGFTRPLMRCVSIRAAVGTRLGSRLPTGKGQPKNAAVHREPLLGERTRVVRQFVALANVLDLRCDLGVSTAGHVRIQVMFDLVTQVAADDVEEGAAVD